MNKGRPTEKPITTVVVYKKPTGKRHWMLTTENEIDEIINTRKRNSLLPKDCEIIEMGIGKSFISLYKNQYNIK